MHGAWFTPGSPFPGKWGWRSRDWSAVVHLPALVCGVSLHSLVFASSTTKLLLLPKIQTQPVS